MVGRGEAPAVAPACPPGVLDLRRSEISRPDRSSSSLALSVTVMVVWVAMVGVGYPRQ